MPFYLTESASSRVTKRRAPPKLNRSSSLPFGSSKSVASLRRAQTAVAALGEVSEDDEDDGAELKRGKVISTLPQPGAKDVLASVGLITGTIFEALPERAGMNSVKIAEVLNFRRDLPRVVTMAHLHGLGAAGSSLEREVQALLMSNKMRKLKLVGRGNDVSGLGEVLISTEDYLIALHKSSVSAPAKSAFISSLQRHAKATSLPSSELSQAYLGELTRAGFLTNQSLFNASGKRSSSVSSSLVASIPSISRSASGSIAAVGGEAAFENLGGVNGARRTTGTNTTAQGREYILSIPNLAAYLQLLEAARNHYLELLKGFSRHKQAPMYLLKERWNGNVDDNSAISTAKQIRGQFSNVLAAQTKKWKTLYGMSFDWVTVECLGAGLIEVFETGSVGHGVRALV
ncbi:hypothetical protein LTR66_014492 [Elasticomyces elasticus]|nr:hypothetical protein LTR66_014492 [Elasticomyces elasticus]